MLAPRRKALRVECDLSAFLRLQSAENFSRTADKLVKFEREYGSPVGTDNILRRGEKSFECCSRTR